MASTESGSEQVADEENLYQPGNRAFPPPSPVSHSTPLHAVFIVPDAESSGRHFPLTALRKLHVISRV
ncbi:hypothetical protein Q5P01_017804 [Channa striata]|uniref:Uncharacterized protein n=1 Tax=Channa striata TaxID=64152 RepID=A0AA88SDE7_CHASR|nr:hypothetical protein Q5P01_017804 [Channa striata]